MASFRKWQEMQAWDEPRYLKDVNNLTSAIHQILMTVEMDVTCAFINLTVCRCDRLLAVCFSLEVCVAGNTPRKIGTRRIGARQDRWARRETDPPFCVSPQSLLVYTSTDARV